MVVENHKLPRVTYNLTLDNPPLRKDKKGVDQQAVIGSGNTKVTKRF
jgi:hypothetical protein